MTGPVVNQFRSDSIPLANASRDSRLSAQDVQSFQGALAGSNTQPDAQQTYTVRSGDTLSEIAQRHGVSLSALVRANPQIRNPDLIYPDQQITLPGSAGSPSAPGSSSGSPGSPASPGTTSTASAGTGQVNIDAVLDAVPSGVRNANPAAREHIERIVSVARQEGLSKEQTAYVLATATHESNLGLNMEEFASGAAYEGRRDLGNTQPGDGVRFKGRGYVQITGRANYQDWSNRLGIDLVGNPKLAEDPDIAAQILVRGMRDGTFTGRKLDDYINASGNDFHNARRTVNGTDRAGLIAGYAQNYDAALAGFDNAAPAAGSTSGANGSVAVGPEGSGADLQVKAGANIDNLGQPVLDAFDDIVAAYQAQGGPTPVITSGNDSRHSDGSLHFRDLAVDLRANNISDQQARAIANDLAARLGPDFDVIFEHFPGNVANDHIHVEYDPR